MRLNRNTKHEHCSIGVLKRHTGPHTGELVCVDTLCKRKSKHIKWVTKKEYNDIKDIIKNEDTQR